MSTHHKDMLVVLKKAIKHETKTLVVCDNKKNASSLSQESNAI
jgi:hypothetical protein